MYAKEITNLQTSLIEITSEQLTSQISKLLELGIAIDFSSVKTGLYYVASNNRLLEVDISARDKLPLLHFYNGKFWNNPQKTPAEIGKSLKDTNTAKLHERILQLEKQLSIKSLEVENLEVRLNRALLQIGHLTIERNDIT